MDGYLIPKSSLKKEEAKMRTMRMLAVLALLLVFTIPGVFALWRYSNAPLTPGSLNIVTNMTEFKETKGVIIKSVERESYSGVDVIDYGYSLKAIHESTVDPTRTGGNVTYKITLFNNTDSNYWFIGEDHSSYYGQNSLIGTKNGITVTFKDHASDTTNTFNNEDRIPPKTERIIYVTYSYGSSTQGECETSVELLFDIRIDAVQDEFLTVLNNVSVGYGYDYLAEVFNQVYKESGGVSISTESHPEVFDNLFGDLSVNIDGEEKIAHVVIRRENLDRDPASGDAYSNGGPSGCEYTLYITVDSLVPGQSAKVYAISYSEGASGMGDAWYQVGELYEGTAPVKSDGSIDYSKWKAVYKEYKIANGIVYKVGASNGDQYDKMNTMEELISAVDQDIFNDIDNSGIFKKAYDIIKSNSGSDDPAVVGLRKAFDDAALFYRNYNNGQEFKVVRDKYTRAEIIYAISNLQAAMDYYYQTFGNS